ERHWHNRRRVSPGPGMNLRALRRRLSEATPPTWIAGTWGVYRSRSGQTPHSRIDVQLGKTTVNWKQRTLRFPHLILAIENTPVFTRCSAELANGAQMEHREAN